MQYVTIKGGNNFGPVNTTVSGGVIEAPNYVDGVSDPADWPNELLKPAPVSRGFGRGS